MALVTDLKVTERERSSYTTITVNGQNAEMLFDTGGEDNLLLQSSARRLGLPVRSLKN
jgi:predicted aspartyl protease